MNAFFATVTILGFFLVIFGFIILMRYLSYRETLALAEKGLLRADISRDNGKSTLRWGIVIASLGLALCIGLYPIGWVAGGNLYPLHFGPWMLVGLIPLFFGLGLVLIYVVTSEPKPNTPATPNQEVVNQTPVPLPMEAVSETER
jgi:hypothetical protein